MINMPTILENNLDKKQLKTAMLITECNRKIHKPILYNKAINDPIHSRRWREVIENKLQNIKNHQIWDDKAINNPINGRHGRETIKDELQNLKNY